MDEEGDEETLPMRHLEHGVLMEFWVFQAALLPETFQFLSAGAKGFFKVLCPVLFQAKQKILQKQS